MPVCIEDQIGAHTMEAEEKCNVNIVQDLNNKVLLNKEKSKISWSRSRPDAPNVGSLFCLPSGDDGGTDNNQSYVCDNTIGLEYPYNRTGNYTFINLGDGEDYVEGIVDIPSIISLGSGSKRIQGGDKDDLIILHGNFTIGNLNGGLGSNIIDLGDFSPANDLLEVYLDLGYIKNSGHRRNWLEIGSIQKVLARKGKMDRISCSCDTEYIDGRGGSDSHKKDSILIGNYENCSYAMKLKLYPYTLIKNEAMKGNFIYIVPGIGSGDAIVNLSNGNSSHLFLLNHTIYDIDSIKVENDSVKFNFIDGVNTLRLMPAPRNLSNDHYRVSDNSFGLEVSNGRDALYQLEDNTKIRVVKDKLIAIQNSDRSVESIITDYCRLVNGIDLPNRLRMSIFIHSNNQTIAIGQENHDILYNDPNHVTHLVGNGGENVYVIDCDDRNMSIPEVFIYDLDKENKIDTLDLSKIKKKLEDRHKQAIDSRVVTSHNDLGIELFSAQQGTMVKVILKDALLTNWHERLHVLLDKVSMKIEEFVLKPLPIVFGEDKKIIVITPEDVEKDNRIVVSQQGGDYSFMRSGNDLTITNALDDSVAEPCTISLKEFYQESKMETLVIKFNDKELMIKNELAKIHSAPTLEAQKSLVNQEIKTLLGNVTIEQPLTAFSNDTLAFIDSDQETLLRDKRSNEAEDFVTSSAVRPTSWMSNLWESGKKLMSKVGYSCSSQDLI